MSKSSIAILVFVYARPKHTEALLSSLKLNFGFGSYPVIIFSDGPKTEKSKFEVEETRKILFDFKAKNLNVELRIKSSNVGLASSIISGVSEVLNSFESVVVLEDDLVLSPDFLRYMIQSLTQYRTNEKVWSITGYSFPFVNCTDKKFDNYALPRAMSWGWGTWRDRWENVDWDMQYYKNFSKSSDRKKGFSYAGEDLLRMLKLQWKGKISSWAIRWCFAHYQNNAYCMYPTKSLVRNEGFDGSGEHCKATTRYDVSLDGGGDGDFSLMENVRLTISDVDALRHNHRLSFLKKCATYCGF